MLTADGMGPVAARLSMKASSHGAIEARFLCTDDHILQALGAMPFFWGSRGW